MNKEFKFSVHDPLKQQDNEQQTYGCRCNNPDICRNYGTINCGLTNSDHICKTPSRAWKKYYEEKLKNHRTD